MRLEHWLYTVPLRLRSLVRRKAVEQELDEELRFHIEEQAAQLIASGMPRAEAYLAARRALGGIELRKEQCRDTRRVSRIENIVRDVRYAARVLWNAPGFTAVAVLTLALGIGANSAIFSLVDAVLLRPLPFREPERLVRIWETKPRANYFRNVVNPFNFLDWRERSRSFEFMAAVADQTINLSADGQPVAVPSLAVSPEFFQVLGATPLLGRAFTAEEGTPGRYESVILSHSLWQTHFGGRPGIVGSKIPVNGSMHTIVGVMPPGFSIPKQRAEAWIPLPIDRSDQWKSGRYLSVVARLRPGVTMGQARQDMAAVAIRSGEERPDFNRGWSAEVVPLLEDAVEDVRLPLLVLLAAVGFVMLIACANVANLLLMRGTGRSREMALRTALGAARGRIVQQLLMESLLLSAASLATGLPASKWLLRSFLSLIPLSTPLPRFEPVAIDARVFGFACLLSLATAVLFGLVPALRISRVELQDALRAGGRPTASYGHQAMRRTFVVAEVALALLLAVGAGLMLRSFQKLAAVNPGFQTDHLLTMQIWTSPAKYSDDRKRAGYYERILAEIRSVPGVVSAGSIHVLPLTERLSGSCFAPAGQPAPTPAASPGARFLIVSPGYFDSIRMRVASGRDFSERDRFGAPGIAIVNQSFVQRFLGGREPLGERLNVCWTIANPVEIVGVVADARQTDLADAPKPTIFLPNAQSPMYLASLVVRTGREPQQIARAVEAAIHRVDPDQPVSDIRSMDSVLSDSVSQPRFRLVLLLAFAAIAIALASLGVYGVVSYSVTQRTRDIGIRIALGAGGGDVARMIVNETLALAAAGVAIGLAGALALTRVLRSLLFEVEPADPATLAAVSVLLLAVAVTATVPPARRALRVDPITALRYE